MITATYTPKNVKVEIVSVWEDGNRKRVSVRALSGEPFVSMSHGGLCPTAKLITSADLLSDFRQDDRPLRRSRAVGRVQQPERAYRADLLGMFPTTITDKAPNLNGD